MKVTLVAACVWIFLCPTAVLGAAADRPGPVSPGSQEVFATIASRCPTFSWTDPGPADALELVVYRVPEVEGSEATAVLETVLPGSAASWTPSLERCLAPGARYAWAVRALAGDAVSEWSPPSLFRVPAPPSADELQRALAVVQAHLRASRESRPPSDRMGPGEGRRSASAPVDGGVGEGAPEPFVLAVPNLTGLAAEVPDPASVTFGVYGISKSASAGSAGVVGESTAASGNTIGVAGQVASAGGSAGVFENLAGGDILRGSSGGLTVFAVDGTGEVVAAGFVGDGSQLVGVSAANSELLDALDSSQFLRSDASDAFTAGTLSLEAGTTLDMDGALDAGDATALNLPGGGISGAGDGSGLDADLLDGMDAADFLATGTDLWVDETGDTMTGNLNLSGAGLDIDGKLFLRGASGHSNTSVGINALENNPGVGNTAVGYQALRLSLTGDGNTAVGEEALESNSGDRNTAIGTGALIQNSGSSNTAVGVSSMSGGIFGSNNTALGADALLGGDFQGSGNTAVGQGALGAPLFEADQNTAIGALALEDLFGGTANTVVGYQAASDMQEQSDNVIVGANAAMSLDGDRNIVIGTGAGGFVNTDDNIIIGTMFPFDPGVATIQIGDTFTQEQTYIAGIRDVTTVEADAITVVVSSDGQLGTMSSSRRFKEEIRDLGATSSRVHRLRPVSFRYKAHAADGDGPPEYGLIAEEVAEVFPELVVRDADGRPQTVKYRLLAPLLLAELQKQRRELAEQQRLLRSVLALLEGSGG